MRKVCAVEVRFAGVLSQEKIFFKVFVSFQNISTFFLKKEQALENLQIFKNLQFFCESTSNHPHFSQKPNPQLEALESKSVDDLSTLIRIFISAELKEFENADNGKTKKFRQHRHEIRDNVVESSIIFFIQFNGFSSRELAFVCRTFVESEVFIPNIC